jgi:hypothetical protein
LLPLAPGGAGVKQSQMTVRASSVTEFVRIQRLGDPHAESSQFSVTGVSERVLVLLPDRARRFGS